MILCSLYVHLCCKVLYFSGKYFQCQMGQVVDFPKSGHTFPKHTFSCHLKFQSYDLFPVDTMMTPVPWLQYTRTSAGVGDHPYFFAFYKYDSYWLQSFLSTCLFAFYYISLQKKEWLLLFLTVFVFSIHYRLL